MLLLTKFSLVLTPILPFNGLQLVNRVTAISEISCVFRNNRDKLTDEKWRRSKCDCFFQAASS
jgi:hypothetical protein